MAVRIIVDSGTDIPSKNNQDIKVVPLHVTFDNVTYEDGLTITHDQFYKRLIEFDSLPVSSQVNPAEFAEAINSEKCAHPDDEILILTMSSELSGTYQSALIAADDFEDVYVIDTLNVSIGARAFVDYAVRLRDQGLSAKEMLDILIEKRPKCHAIAMLNTLEFLKRGGRISKTAAVAGGILQLKPVITTNEGRIDLMGAARGSKSANNHLNNDIAKLGGIDPDMPIQLGYSGISDALLRVYIEDSAHLLPPGITPENCPIMTIGCAVGTHAGPDAIALGFFTK